MDAHSVAGWVEESKLALIIFLVRLATHYNRHQVQGELLANPRQNECVSRSGVDRDTGKRPLEFLVLGVAFSKHWVVVLLDAKVLAATGHFGACKANTHIVDYYLARIIGHPV